LKALFSIEWVIECTPAKNHHYQHTCGCSPVSMGSSFTSGLASSGASAAKEIMVSKYSKLS